jgi:hypothetical protein
MMAQRSKFVELPAYEDVAHLLLQEDAPLWLNAHLEWWAQSMFESLNLFLFLIGTHSNCSLSLCCHRTDPPAKSNLDIRSVLFSHTCLLRPRPAICSHQQS